MAGTKTLELFQNPSFALAFDLIEKMQQPLAAHPAGFALPALSLERGTDFQLLDRPVAMRGGVSVEAEVLAAGAGSGELFDPVTVCTAAAGGRLAELRFGSELELKMDFAGGGGQLALSARASATSRLEYRHVVAIAATAETTLLDAFAQLAKTTRLPARMTFAGSLDGSIHHWSALLDLDFGLDAKYGSEFRFGLEKAVFEGLPAALRIGGEVTVNAALGLGLYERMVLTIGRGHGTTTQPGWVRARIEREHRQRLSLGATVALQAKWDLGASLAAILDKAFDQIPPLPRAVQTLETLSRELAATGGWDVFKAKVSGRLADQLSEWLAATGWREWAANDPRVAELLGTSREVVDAYRQLGPKLQSWWDHFLDGAELGPGSPVRKLLGQLAGLDVANLDLDALLASARPDLARVIELIEVFTGKSLDDILLGTGEEPRRWLAQAVAEAQKALRFLDQLPADVLTRIQGFAQRTGIAGVIDFLAANASSLQQVESFVSARIRALAARLVDTAADQLSAADVAKIQTWARRVKKLFDAPAELHAKLAATIEKLEGDLGFSLALEIDRVSSRTALIDVEVDPSNAHADLHAGLEKALRQGSVGGMLQALDEKARALTGTDRDGDEAKTAEKPFPFLLRECTFASRNVRTSAVQTLLSLTGLGKTFSSVQKSIDERVQETSLTLSQVAGGEPPVFRRTGSWSGGYTRTEIHNKTTDRTSVWIVAEDAGSGLGQEAVFDDAGGPELGLRLCYCREDEASGSPEIKAITGLLIELGFGAEVDAVAAAIPNEVASRLSISLRLPLAALEAFLGDLREKTWNEPFLAAARRWLDEKTTFVAFPAFKDANRGDVLEAITRSEVFLSHWMLGSRDLAQAVGTRGLSVRLGSANKPVQPFEPPQLVYRSPFLPLKVLIDRRSPGLAHQKKIAAALAAAKARRTPAAYRDLIAAAALGWHRTQVASGSWPSSTFALWLLIARLTEVAPEQLRQVTGVALLRHREVGSDRWSEPTGWRLVEGLHPFVAGM